MSDHEHEKIERLKRAIYSRTDSNRVAPRERRGLHEEVARVGEDWVRTEPKLNQMRVAPRTIGAPRAALTALFGAAIVFFLAASGVFAYYFFVGPGSSPASPQNIDINISGPTQVSGGDVTELQIVVLNRNPVPLQNADLVVTYPAGTRSPSDLKTALPSQRISLGTIESGGRRQGAISAVFSGAEHGSANVKVELEYRLQNSNSIFVASSNYALSFISSPLSIAIDSDTEAISGQLSLIAVHVTSNASSIVRDVVLTAQYPFGYSFTSADPVSTGDGFWELGDIRPGETKTVTLRGMLQGDMGDERVFRFAAGLRNTPSDRTISAQLADFEQHIFVTRPFFGLSIALNKDTTQVPIAVVPGSTVELAVRWQNNLDTPITNAVIVASLKGIDIAGETVRTNDGFYRSVDNVIIWDKDTTKGALASIAPGAKGTVQISFQVPNSETLGNVRAPHLDITVHAAATRLGQTSVPESLQSTAMRTLKIASDVSVFAQGFYYLNPFTSTGPLPPKAGTETTYAVVYTIRNTTNPIKSARLTATLPPYVRWAGVYSPASEKISYNQSSGTITWDIGDVAAGVGAASTTPRQLAFSIGFTPSTSQIGQQPSLLSSIMLTGVDSYTGQTIALPLNDLTTNLTKSSKYLPQDISLEVAGDSGFTAEKATVVK